jgi:hypothetical protein
VSVPPELIANALLYVLFPIWLVAGIADYLCHRRTSIEHTSGRGESALHVLQAIEIGVPLLAGLFFEINALVLAIMIVGVVAHSLTALWDSSYSNSRRYISPLEQHVHSHLEYVPLVALLLVALLHWGQLRALFGMGSEPPAFALAPKEHPIPLPALLTVLVSIIGVHGALLAEEFLRTSRHAAGRSDARSGDASQSRR